MGDILVVGIAGGTASGKTTLMKRIKKEFGDSIAVLSHDNYYKPRRELPLEERKKLNFDEPAALETELMVHHLKLLRQGQPIQCPQYDFTTHDRKDETVTIVPKRVIVVEGILIFEDAALRELMDIRVFVDTDADERLCRRILRDVRERKRTLEDVVEQYLTTVKPMHDQYVEPSKRYANVAVYQGGENQVALELLLTRMREHLNREA